MRFKRICAIWIVILITTQLISCDSAQEQSKDGLLSHTSLSEQRRTELAEFIKQSEPEWHTNEFQQYGDLPPFSGCSLAASDKMCNVGIEGVPIILDIALNDEYFYGSYPRSYLLGGMYVILRIDNQEALGCAGSYVHLECIKDYYLISQKECYEIIKSKKIAEEKIAELRKFGVLALPYVIKQIEKGENEYMPFFTAIGLHLSHKSYAHLVLDKYAGCYEDAYTDEEYLSGAEDFDYKVWLSENEEDLDNLFKFLDAYCAEYEAEMEN